MALYPQRAQSALYIVTGPDTCYKAPQALSVQ